MNEEREHISGWFEYRTDLFEEKTIAKLAESFLLLFRDGLRDPDCEVARLSLVPDADQARLQTWNGTTRDLPRDNSIHRLFEEQAARTPDAVAVIHGSAKFSYAELNHKANRIAHGLLRLGLERGSIVGVHLERSVDMIAAMLGILKAGSAYLPLDPQYPAERIRYMVQDSQCSTILSASGQGDAIVDGARVLAPDCLDEPDVNPGVDVQLGQLAGYVIYTSGSTGEPKGVAIEHHSTVSFLQWARRTFPAETLRGTLAATSISFDLSVFEIFLPLVMGATVILAKDILELGSIPAAAEVTLATTVPSAIGALLDAKSIPSTLGTINLAGEPLSTALVERIYSETGVTTVNDLYGPTETTTYSTWTRRLPGKAATIGRPIDNTRLYLVDPALELVPIGMPGELLIAGEGVARGYLGKTQLTAEKFVSLEHLGEAERAYRTGDLCLWTDDGELVYQGRLDQQVKMRGFRIEPGEIETAIRSFPGIEEAVVTCAAVDGHPTLVAAVRLRADHALDTAAIIEHQAKTLPAFMVARNIFSVQEYPHTTNGKIDRKRIAELFTPKRLERQVELPHDPLERALVAIWEAAFHLQPLGVDDDFFKLGGHSLLALRIFSEIEAKLGQKMMLSVLFQAPTIRALADFMRRERAS